MENFRSQRAVGPRGTSPWHLEEKGKECKGIDQGKRRIMYKSSDEYEAASQMLQPSQDPEEILPIRQTTA